MSKIVTPKRQLRPFTASLGLREATTAPAHKDPREPSDLRRVVRTLHRILRDYEGNSSLVERFDELTKAIYCKTFDERDSELNMEESAFRIRTDDTEQSVATRIREKFHKLVERRPDLFPQRFSNLRMGDSAISKLAQELAGIRLAGVSEDLKGLLYEEIIRNTFDKGENQQFFTPRPIVEFMVQILDSSMSGTICDPACGTGGFLLYVDRHLKQSGHLSGTYLLGFEVDERLAWVAGVNLNMNYPSQRFTISHIDTAGSLGNGPKPIMGTVNTIITNPPFGSDLSEKEALNEFELGRGRTSRRRGVLFIERCLDLLKPGGTVGIIIDDGVLNSPSNTDTRRLILERSHPLAIISLPDTAFMPYASVKASILFLQKKTVRKSTRKDNLTFFAHAETVGRKPNGDPMVRHDPTKGKVVLDSSLPKILAAWRKNAGDQQKWTSHAEQQSFWANVPGTKDKAFGKSGFRIDLAYHHPTRNRAEEALRTSRHPVKSVGEICDLRNEGSIPSKDMPEEEITYLGLANIETRNGKYILTQVNGSTLKSSVKRFVAGDILFAKMRPELRKVCLIGNDTEEGFASAECIVLTPKRDPETHSPIIFPELLTILLRSELVYGQTIHLVTGIGRPRLSKAAILNAQLPIPPVQEQKRLLDLYHRSESAARSLESESERALDEAHGIRSNAGRSLVNDILEPAKV